MHKSSSKVVTHLKNNNHTPNGSTDLMSSQNEGIKENASTASKIAVIDIERENRLSKVISLYSKGLNQEEIAKQLNVDHCNYPH